MMICRQRLIVLFFLLEHMVLGGFHFDKEQEDQDWTGESLFPTALRFEAGCWGSHLDSQLCSLIAATSHRPLQRTQEKYCQYVEKRRLCGGQQHCVCCSYSSFRTNNKQIKTSHIRDKIVHICNYSTWETEVVGWKILGNPILHTCFFSK